MQSCSMNRKGSDMAANAVQLTPLAQEARSGLPTSETARHVNRAPQTLRLWAMRGNGPIQPRKINGRLMWPTDEIRRLLGVEGV